MLSGKLNGGVNYEFLTGSMNFLSFLEINFLNVKHTVNAYNSLVLFELFKHWLEL